MKRELEMVRGERSSKVAQAGSAWVIALVSLLTAGCLEIPGPVDLEIVIENENGPVEDAIVLLMPARLLDDNQWKRPYSFGRTDSKGHTRLRSEAGTVGALPGAYRAWVVETDVDLSRESGPAPMVRYTIHPVKVVSASVTPRIQLRHEDPRVLEDVPLTPLASAEESTTADLAKTLAKMLRTLQNPGS